ncbi:MAG TPA: signal recognition particle-docking protein FtsY [Candidatus Hydrogenedens sp.]|nr:signal recognition particle-docking protein FtsY [Candidatus Hydrogenedens sp.]HOK09536.1 signal recognition particle-docking protein FtsY [Candidatus Hydrogenedens sp.]HOL19183.1 signal recognition particle-docking protein FtsY [Candidatus Hydrogenedens sp.]HPP58399.1 signal recognition particle-docking protein FtsY [Candidatus Hydrogenedens sp.]
MFKMTFFSNLKQKLQKTRSALADGIKNIFSLYPKLSDDVYNSLEELLIEADLGVNTSLFLIERLKEEVKKQGITEPEQALALLKSIMTEMLTSDKDEICWVAEPPPHVTLIVGVNGSGKTTTAGKISALLGREGKKVILAAGDTFRAAAGEQLEIWSQRSGAELIRHQEGADPAAVAYDAVDAGIARKANNVIIDTAGRLHTKVNLMEELKKIHRVIKKRMPEAPHEVLLVLDATTGQNAMQQARIFTEALNITGIVLTKLDGTAKGGVVLGIQRELNIPIRLIGVGESVEDLQPFDPNSFVDALFNG